MSVTKHWGRRLKFDSNQRALMADLIREHGARGAIVHAPEPVSLKTMLTIAREFEIPLKKGRRSTK